MKEQIVKAQMLLAGLLPVAGAVSGDVPNPPDPSITSYCELICKITLVAQWMYGILMILGVIFVLYAAFLYLISQGSDERIGTAKKVLIYAIVALVIAVLAWGVSGLVEGWMTSGTPGGTGCTC